MINNRGRHRRKRSLKQSCVIFNIPVRTGKIYRKRGIYMN